MSNIISALRKIKQIITVCINRLSVKLMRQPTVLGMDETIKVIKERRASISRYGDGEFRLIFGGRIGFQKYDSGLAIKLKKVLKKNGESNRFLVGIPDCFGNMEQFKKIPREHWQLRLDRQRIKWVLSMNTREPYYNAQITRFYFDWADKSKSEQWYSRLKALWDNTDVLLVEGRYSRVGVGNSLFDNAKSVRRILCPEKDAFDCYDKILYMVSENAKKTDLVYLALGPTATVLAYDLFLMGYWALDLGHLDVEYEWMRLKCDEKMALPGKYINEVNGGRFEDIPVDKKYVSEIIGKVE